MKCIRYYNPKPRIVRVDDDKAAQEVKAGKAMYETKTAWKRCGRNYE